MFRELLETEHELVHTRYRISHENRGTIGQTVYVFSDFILLDSDLCLACSVYDTKNPSFRSARDDRYDALVSKRSVTWVFGVVFNA